MSRKTIILIGRKNIFSSTLAEIMNYYFPSGKVIFIPYDSYNYSQDKFGENKKIIITIVFNFDDIMNSNRIQRELAATSPFFCCCLNKFNDYLRCECLFIPLNINILLEKIVSFTNKESAIYMNIKKRIEQKKQLLHADVSTLKHQLQNKAGFIRSYVHNFCPDKAPDGLKSLFKELNEKDGGDKSFIDELIKEYDLIKCQVLMLQINETSNLINQIDSHFFIIEGIINGQQFDKIDELLKSLIDIVPLFEKLKQCLIIK